MGQSITYPNGQTLTSTALTPTTITENVQTLTCGVLGINPPDYSKVRVAWQQQGQPFSTDPTMDVCYVSCVPQDDDYNRVRDQLLSGPYTGPITETWTYTRGWKVSWFFYGPNSSDNARAVWSSLFTDYAAAQLAAVNLYAVTDPPSPTRLPQELNGQWWEYADFHVELYEQVTETIEDGSATSVEIKVEDSSGQVADITVAT